MAPRETIDTVRRDRLRRWMQWCVDSREKGGLGMSQAALAKKLDISAASVSNILSGQANMGFDIFLALHDEMSVSADLLLDHEPEYKPFRR